MHMQGLAGVAATSLLWSDTQCFWKPFVVQNEHIDHVQIIMSLYLKSSKISQIFKSIPFLQKYSKTQQIRVPFLFGASFSGDPSGTRPALCLVGPGSSQRCCSMRSKDFVATPSRRRTSAVDCCRSACCLGWGFLGRVWVWVLFELWCCGVSRCVGWAVGLQASCCKTAIIHLLAWGWVSKPHGLWRLPPLVHWALAWKRWRRWPWAKKLENHNHHRKPLEKSNERCLSHPFKRSNGCFGPSTRPRLAFLFNPRRLIAGRICVRERVKCLV